MSAHKKLPGVITSYDLLKSLALILMIIDHTGYFFFAYDEIDPDQGVLWFRVLGRLCVPIWFFLIGYARTTDVPLKWWAAAFIVLFSKMLAGQYILPLNIIFTLMAARYIRPWVMERVFYSPEMMRGMFFLLALGALPTGVFIEYGSIVMLFTVFGYMVRNRKELTIDKKYQYLFVLASFFVFFFSQGLALPTLSYSQTVFMFAGFIFIAVLLAKFRPATYPQMTKRLGFLKYLIFLTGRRTLEIYVLHLFIFRMVAMYLYPYKYVLWGWSIAQPGLLSMITH